MGSRRSHIAPLPSLGFLVALWPFVAAASPSVDSSVAPVDAGVAETDAGMLQPNPGTGERSFPRSGQPLVVGYTGSAPFVLPPVDGVPTGLSIAVWEALAVELELATHFVEFGTVTGLLDAVAAGEVDVGIGPISVTASRADRVEFTQPYFSARVGILSPSASGWERLRPFFNRAFLVGVATLLTVLLCVGTLVWLLERRRNPEQFPAPPGRGIPEGMWFALVTMTTVGYGDRTPVTGPGRLVAGMWMLFAMVAASSITAGIATALTLSQIERGGITSLEDIARRRVAVVRGTPAQGLVVPHGARPLVVATLEEGVDAVMRGWAEAMLYDLPVLDYHAQMHPAQDLWAQATSQRADDYAFAVAVGSSMRGPLSRAVVALRERGQIATIAEEWSVQP